MLTVSQAQEWIIKQMSVLEEEQVPLEHVLLRALAEPIAASSDSPSFDNTAVDGYAVYWEDTVGASPIHPVTLQQCSYLPAGSRADQSLPRASAARIMTGAPVPEGADAIVMIEQTKTIGDTVYIHQEARKGDHIRRKGEDIQSGTALIERGATVNAGLISVLASQGVAFPAVYRLPKIGILSTGDELVSYDQEPEYGQIRNSNLPLLNALVKQTPAQISESSHCEDNPEAIQDQLKRLAQMSDAIITCGGVSAGDRDYLRPAIETLGRLEFAGVKVKPGKPFIFGYIDSTPIFALPGNPLAVFVGFELFARPALRKMSGHSHYERSRLIALAAHEFRAPKGRDEYARAYLFQDQEHNHQLLAASSGFQASHAYSSLLKTNALIKIPADTGLKQFEPAETLLLSDKWF